MNQKRTYLKSSVISLALMLVMLFAMSITAAAATPTNLTQTSDSDTSVRVDWTGVAGAKYYGIQVATDQNFTNVVKQDYTTATWSYEYITGLASGSTYYVRIGYGATSSTCYANWSARLQVVTTPARVTALKFTNADSTTFTLTWPAVSGANMYTVTYNGQAYTTTSNSIKIPYVPGASSAKVASARKSASGYVSEASATYLYSGITALTKKISKSNFGFVNAWTALNDYQIGANYYGTGMEVKVYNAKTGKAKFSGTANNTTYGNVEFIKKFKYSTMYKYRVRAYIVTTDGNKIYGSWSAYRYFVTPKKCTYTTSNRKIKLSWSKLTGVTKIKVQISKSQNSGYKTCATLKGTKTSYTITKYGKKKLTKGKTYYVRVLYYNGSSKSDIVSQTSAITVR